MSVFDLSSLFWILGCAPAWHTMPPKDIRYPLGLWCALTNFSHIPQMLHDETIHSYPTVQNTWAIGHMHFKLY